MDLIKVGIERGTISILFHIHVIHQNSEFLHNPHNLFFSFLYRHYHFFNPLDMYNLFEALRLHECVLSDFLD